MSGRPKLQQPVRAIAGMALLAITLVGLVGCVTPPQPAKVDFAQPAAPEIPSARKPTAPTGSLYSASTFRPGFEDRRARLVGDIVTIDISENLAASQKSTSTANRTSSTDASISALPGLAFPPDNENRSGIGAKAASDFSGKGGTESANTFTGSITAVVAEVLPNGHLLVVGEKQIGVNQNVDVLRFSGTIDPRSILPGSIVSSTQVANVRVESRGRGAQYEAQTVGWLTRFFFSVWPF